jgi:DNA-binding transcriptional ArsR family regulator
MTRAAKPLLRRIDPGVLGRAAQIIKLLGHRERLMIVEALEGGERTVSDIYGRCNLDQAICSQHLRKLRELGVVEARKQGLNVHYRIVEPKVYHILNCIRKCDT